MNREDRVSTTRTGFRVPWLAERKSVSGAAESENEIKTESEGEQETKTERDRERAMRNQMSVREHKKWVTPQRSRQPVCQTMKECSSSSALGEEQTSLCVCLSLPTSRTRSAPDRASPAQAAAAISATNLSQQLFNCRTLLPVYMAQPAHRKDQSNCWRRRSSSSVGTRVSTRCTLLAPRLLFSWRRELGVCRICSN